MGNRKSAPDRQVSVHDYIPGETDADHIPGETNADYIPGETDVDPGETLQLKGRLANRFKQLDEETKLAKIERAEKRELPEIERAKKEELAKIERAEKKKLAEIAERERVMELLYDESKWRLSKRKYYEDMYNIPFNSLWIDVEGCPAHMKISLYTDIADELGFKIVYSGGIAFRITVVHTFVYQPK